MPIEGLLGRKLGMTQVFDANGEAHGVTVVEAGPCVVVQIKTAEKDGYDAIQLGFGRAKKRVNKPMRGHLKRLGDEPAPARVRRRRRERVQRSATSSGVELFEEGDIVDVVGTSKGRGFAGGVKRHHFHGGPKTHGQSDRHRAPGLDRLGHDARAASARACAWPGHMGAAQVTSKNLRVIAKDEGKGLLLIEGAVPGATNGTERRVRRASPRRSRSKRRGGRRSPR